MKNWMVIFTKVPTLRHSLAIQKDCVIGISVACTSAYETSKKSGLKSISVIFNNVLRKTNHW